MGSRKEQAAQTRQKIMDAAIELINQKEYDQIKISDIAKACEMSIGNFYHYFKSMDELFAEVDSVQFYDVMEDIKPKSGSSVLASLESYFLGWIQMMTSYTGVTYSSHWLRYYTRQSLPASQSRTELLSKHICQILDNGIASGELRSDTPTYCISYSLAFCLMGSTIHYSTTENHYFITQWAEDFFKTFVVNALSPYLTNKA